MKKIFLILAVSSIGFAASAQKIGYLDSKELIASLPESKVIDSTYKQYYETLATEIKNLNAELNEKSELFIKDSSTFLPAIKQYKLDNIRSLSDKIKNFQTQAEKDLKSKGDSLLKPLQLKIKNALNEVAKENGYDIIIEQTNLSYINEKYNIIKLVQKKLLK